MKIMIKTIVVRFTFIGEGNQKIYERVIDNFGASDFPSIKEVTSEMELLWARLNVDAAKPGTSDL